MLKKSSSNKPSNTDAASTLVCVAKAYIDDGNLASDIMEGGVPLFEHTSFYGYDIITSTVSILLTGKSPDHTENLSGNIHYNVINFQYCSTIIYPLI